MRVCATNFLYHYFFQPDADTMESILQSGLRPLSDLPANERWQQIEAHAPGFFKNLYMLMAEPVLKKPYHNSGIFLTPIDFYQLPGTLLAGKPRVRIPVERIDAEWAVLTYELNGERVVLRLGQEALLQTAEVWTGDLVRVWFAKDESRVFYFVPQVAVYQPGGIPITAEDFDTPPIEGGA